MTMGLNEVIGRLIGSRSMVLPATANGSMLPAVNLVLAEFSKTLIETSASGRSKQVSARAADG